MPMPPSEDTFVRCDGCNYVANAELDIEVSLASVASAVEPAPAPITRGQRAHRLDAISAAGPARPVRDGFARPPVKHRLEMVLNGVLGDMQCGNQNLRTVSALSRVMHHNFRFRNHGLGEY